MPLLPTTSFLVSVCNYERRVTGVIRLMPIFSPFSLGFDDRVYWGRDVLKIHFAERQLGLTTCFKGRTMTQEIDF